MCKWFKKDVIPIPIPIPPTPVMPKEPPSLDEYIQWVREQVGPIPRYETSWNEMRTELNTLGIRCMIKDGDIPDLRIFHTDAANLIKIVPYLTFSGEYYVAELDVDCDDYAEWAHGLASLIFNLNGICQAWGQVPEGPHAFSISRVGPMQYKLFEPNAAFNYPAELFDFGEHDYKPERWK